MEQQLIDVLEKAKNEDDIDEVSKAMIAARVTDALVKVRELTAQYLESLEAIQKEHKLELKLGGLAVVLNVTDDMSNPACKGPTQMCVLGPRDKVLKNLTHVMERI